MSAINRGMRNAFRNNVRTLSIVLILGLSIGLGLVMVTARQAVQQKINDVKASVGNTITIAPAGFNPLSQANNALTTSSLAKLKSQAHITNLTETLTDRLTTIGSDQPDSFGAKADSTSNQTSLKSPVKLNNNGNGTFSGGDGGQGFFISGGGSLPANFSPPIQILGTNNPGQLANGAKATIKSGKMIDGSKDTNDAMVSTDMARVNSLKVGSTFTAYGQTLTVAGIFNSGTQGGNDVVVVSLPALERLSGQAGVVTSATATVDSADNLAATTTAVKSALSGVNADVTSSQDEADNAVKPLENVKSISVISLIGALVAGSVIVLLTMIMIVRERRREIGILKALGASNLKVMLQFMSEALTLTILAAVVGLIIGVAGAGPVTNTLVTNSTNSSSPADVPGAGKFRSVNVGDAGPVTFQKPSGGFVNRAGGGLKNTLTNIHANVGWNILAYGLGAAILIALIGSAAASWLISKVRPAEVMRAE